MSVSYGGRGVCGLHFYDWFTLSGLLLGMCERVRTRNTLYEVGAAKSKIWHNAVEGRENEKRENKDKLVK